MNLKDLDHFTQGGIWYGNETENLKLYTVKKSGVRPLTILSSTTDAIGERRNCRHRIEHQEISSPLKVGQKQPQNPQKSDLYSLTEVSKKIQPEKGKRK